MIASVGFSFNFKDDCLIDLLLLNDTEKQPDYMNLRCYREQTSEI